MKSPLTKGSAALLAALTAALMVPVAAGASTYVLSPTSTQALQSGWSVTPSTSSADAVLSKSVTQPATPDLSSYVSTDSAGGWTAVGLSSPPAFASGESLRQTTAWAYLSSDPGRTVTLSLWTGNPQIGFTILGSTTVPGGQSGGWYSISTQAPLTPTQLGELALAVQGGGSAGTARVFAAAGEVDAALPAPPQPASTAPELELANVHSDVSIVSPSVSLSAHQSDVGVELSCEAGAVGGCHGVLVLRTLSGAGAARAASTGGQVLAVAARCARGCRILGRSSFDIAAGHKKRVAVHLAHSARHLIRSHRHLPVQAVAITKDGNGNTQITKTTVDLSQATGRGQSPAPAQSGAQPGSNTQP